MVAYWDQSIIHVKMNRIKKKLYLLNIYLFETFVGDIYILLLMSDCVWKENNFNWGKTSFDSLRIIVGAVSHALCQTKSEKCIA